MEVIVLSHYLFDRKMSELGLNDDNVESCNNAFISIIGTPECLEYYLDEGNTKHYFGDHPNVLNLDFDDIEDDVLYNGHHFKAMRMWQAEEAVDFIEEQIGKNADTIFIHCRAGFSRSRAFGEFIYRYCKEHKIEFEYSDRDDYTTMLNSGVLRRLNHAYLKKHGLEENYPDELVNIPVRTINRERNREAWRLNKRVQDEKLSDD